MLVRFTRHPVPWWSGMLLDQITFLDERVSMLTTRISQQLAAIRDAWGIDAGGTTGPQARTSPCVVVLPAADHAQPRPTVRPRATELPGPRARNTPLAATATIGTVSTRILMYRARTGTRLMNHGL
jgi:hypothetical protein